MLAAVPAKPEMPQRFTELSEKGETLFNLQKVTGLNRVHNQSVS
jgi:hypothetical protein